MRSKKDKREGSTKSFKGVGATILILSVALFTQGCATTQTEEGPNTMQVMGALMQLNNDMNYQRSLDIQRQKASNYGGQMPLRQTQPQGMGNASQDWINKNGGW